jgi:hypothetical protein
MTENNKELKIEFAPGAFDNFEGTQEELDEMVAEIQKMFEGKSREEIEAMSNPMTEEEFDELPEDVQLQLMREYGDGDLDDDLSEEFKRKLQ